MKKVVIGLAALLSSLVAASVVAQPAPPSPEEQAQSAVERRQAVFELIAWNFGPVGGMMRRRVPFDAALVAKNSARISHLAEMISDLFQADVREFDLETEALDSIWENQDDFASKAADLVKAADALAEAAASGDQGATMKAAGAVGKACGACHDNYREDN